MGEREIDFTNGDLLKKLMVFSLPLLIGNLLQQGYFIGDSIIVGRFIGKDALGAIGGATAITSMLIFFFQGVSSGIGVVISHFIGSREINGIKNTIRAGAIFTIVAGSICSIVGYLSSHEILTLINVPDELFDDTFGYMRVVMLGLIPMLMYNMGSSVLQAMGDSKTPLYYLALSTFINVILDIVFVSVLRMNVQATALATVIAQIVAASLIFVSIALKIKKIGDNEEPKDNFTEIKRLFAKILKIGLPIGVQSVVISFSNIIVQNHINSIGANTMAAWTVFSRVDSFVIMPFISYKMAVMTMTGQNYGARKYQRLLHGVKVGNGAALITTVAIGLFICAMPAEIFHMFTGDETVINEAVNMVYHMIPFYGLMSLAAVWSSAISGMGNSVVPMIINLVFMCIIRVILIPIFAKTVGYNMNALFYVYWISWSATAACAWSYYHFVTKKRLLTSNEI